MSSIRVSSRDAILEAAFQLLNLRPTASLADIAARAGVGRATLHRHFPGRADLMRALAGQAMEELEAAVEHATRDAETHAKALERAMAAMIPLATRQWFLATDPVAHDPDIARRLARDRDALDAEIEGARAEGAFAPDLPTRWIADVYENLLFAAWTLVREGEATPRQAADLAWRSFLNGVGVRS